VSPSVKTPLVSMLAVALLAGCGGGGGGGGGLSSTLAPLSRTVVPYAGGDLTAPNTVYTAPTSQQAFTYSYSGSTDNRNLRVNVTSVDTSLTTGQLDLGLNANADLDYVRVRSASTSTDFSIFTGSGGVFEFESVGSVQLIGAENRSGSDQVLLATADDFDYQGFGWWLSDTSASSGRGASFSTGLVTPVVNLPASGTASYTGYSVGFYIAADGSPYVTSSRIDATAFFGGFLGSPPYVNLTSSSTNIVNANTGSVSSLSSANFSGALDITAGTSTFSGSVQNTAGTLTGVSSGSFYGPVAEELGGTFRLSGGGISYVGAYGAK
jgi:hypothetical protein